MRGPVLVVGQFVWHSRPRLCGFVELTHYPGVASVAVAFLDRSNLDRPALQSYAKKRGK